MPNAKVENRLRSPIKIKTTTGVERERGVEHPHLNLLGLSSSSSDFEVVRAVGDGGRPQINLLGMSSSSSDIDAGAVRKGLDSKHPHLNLIGLSSSSSEIESGLTGWKGSKTVAGLYTASPAEY